MRFYAHDGTATHGPAGIEELLRLPGFDGDTLVCPVGSDDSADWKPALYYPAFKRALLEAPATSPLSALAPIGAPLSTPMLQSLTPMAMSVSPLSPPKPALPKMPAEPPKPVEVPKPTRLCPACAHSNLDTARFCNACGARMDGTPAVLSPPPAAAPVALPPSAPLPAPASSPAPAAALPPEPPPFPAIAPEPAFDPFAHLDPLRTFPMEPAPEAPLDSPPANRPRRPLQPQMGQLGTTEEPAPAASSFSPSPALAPEPAPPAAAAPAWKRPAVLAAVAGMVVLSAGLAYYYMTLRKSPPRASVAELTPAAESPVPPPIAAPADSPKTEQLYSTPPATSSPAIPDPRASRPRKASKLTGPPATAPLAAADKPKRARKPRALRAAKQAPKPAAGEEASGGDTFIESRAPDSRPKAKGKDSDQDPLLEALLSNATQSDAEPAVEPAAKAAAKTAEKVPPAIGQRPAAKPSQFSLPGLQRPVSASDRAAPSARAPRPAADAEAALTPIAGLDAPLAEPGKSSPPPGIEDQPAKAAEGDQLALVQVHEQFNFCAQLLAQGAFGDHYDTCLCKDAREAAPYRGRRGFYVTAKKKEAGSGQLEATAKILSSKIDGGVASVTARWIAGAGDKGRTSAQTWKLEDGLWCQAP